jgi:hypothetical protein
MERPNQHFVSTLDGQRCGMPQRTFTFRLWFTLRVREEISLHFQESRHPHGKARGGRIASYLTDKQRSQAGQGGSIGALKCEVIFERALNQ